LRRARRAKARDLADKAAAANRVKFGRPLHERKKEALMRKLEDRHITGHKREMEPSERDP